MISYGGKIIIICNIYATNSAIYVYNENEVEVCNGSKSIPFKDITKHFHISCSHYFSIKCVLDFFYIFKVTSTGYK